MAAKAVCTAAAPQAIGPYSQAVEAGGWLFCSGQIPVDPESQTLVAGDVGAATAQVLRNLTAVLAAAGLGLGDVVKTTVYLQDLGDFAAMNEVYAEHFGAPRPARACVEVARLPKGALVEIEAIAVRS